MAQPITWKNLATPDLSGSAATLRGATDTILGAFNPLQKILQEEQARQAHNVNALRTYNAQQFWDQVSQQYQSPEELQAAIQSGAIQELRNSLGPMDWDTTNNDAVNQRISTLQSRIMGNWDFEDKGKERLQKASDTARGQQIKEISTRYAAPLKPGETHTQRYDAAMRELQGVDGISNEEVAAALSGIQSSLAGWDTIQEADQPVVDSILAPVRTRLEQNDFWHAENSTEPVGTTANRLLVGVMASDETSPLKRVLLENDANVRESIYRSVYDALLGYYPGTRERFYEGRVPEHFVNAALNSIKGTSLLNFDKDFTSQLKKQIQSAGFTEQASQYLKDKAEYSLKAAQAKEAMRRGVPVPGQTTSSPNPSQVPTTALDRAAATVEEREAVVPEQTPETPQQVPTNAEVIERLMSTNTAPRNDVPVAVPDPGSDIPRPTLYDMNTANEGLSFLESRMGPYIENAVKSIANTLNERKYNAQKQALADIRAIIDSGTVNYETSKYFNDFITYNGKLLKHLSDKERNKLRDMFGSNRIDAAMKLLK